MSTSIIQGLSDWLEDCPVVDVVDVLQTEMSEEGLYKQPTIETVKYIDGSEKRTEHWYVLFMRSSKLRKHRVSDAEVLEQFEGWIATQDLAENYPDIGHEVLEIGSSDGYYMSERDNDVAVYQATITLTYIR
jgi:hypothetical protein